MITKGKWTVGFKDRGHGHGDFAVLANDGDIIIAELPLSLETQANAKLIAASKDLLEACKKTVRANQTKHGTHYGHATPDYRELMLSVEEAIAKATN